MFWRWHFFVLKEIGGGGTKNLILVTEIIYRSQKSMFHEAQFWSTQLKRSNNLNK